MKRRRRHVPAVLLTIAVPVGTDFLLAALEGLTAVNAVIYSSQPKVPDIYTAGVRYKREQPGRDRWLNCAELVVAGAGDCEDLATARAAWLRVYEAEPARAVPIRGGPHTIHIVVARADGSIEDPSRELGMGASRWDS